MKKFFGKVRKSVQNYLNQNLVIGSFLENDFEATLSLKTNVLSVWKGHFSVFCKFWVTKFKSFTGKVRQSLQNYINQNLVIGSFLENDFEASLSSKMNVLSIWKGRFSVSKISKTLYGKVCNVCYCNVRRFIKKQKMKTELWNLFWQNYTRANFPLIEMKFIKYSS